MLCVFMETIELVMLGVYSLVATYLLYKWFFAKTPYQKEYERLYKEIINSDKHKVRGQWEK